MLSVGLLELAFYDADSRTQLLAELSEAGGWEERKGGCFVFVSVEPRIVIAGSPVNIHTPSRGDARALWQHATRFETRANELCHDPPNGRRIQIRCAVRWALRLAGTSSQVRRPHSFLVRPTNQRTVPRSPGLTVSGRTGRIAQR